MLTEDATEEFIQYEDNMFCINGVTGITRNNFLT